MKILFRRILTLAFCCVVLLPSLRASPRPPGVPYPEFELKSWRFDIPNYVNAEGLGAQIATNLWLAESWSGYALDMTASGSLLITPAVAGPRDTNFANASGTIRLWYSPTAWASASAGGSGPGNWATLIELAQTNTVSHPFGLVLTIDPYGTNLVAAANTETGSVILASASLAWSTGVWHQVALVYDTNTVEIFIDDNNDSISFVALPWPSNSVWNQSAFSLGSAFDGTQLALGQLDEIHTFSYPLSTNYLTWSYQLYAPVAALGPILDEGGGALTSSEPFPSPCDPCEGEGGGGTTNDFSGFFATNGFRFLATPYVTNGTSYFTTLWDTNTTTNAYEIYTASTLESNSWIFSSWSLAVTGAVGVTNFTLPYSTNSLSAFFRAARYVDSDNDGLTDAFEELVSKTTNTLWDTDGDGVPDGFEWTHGTQPLNWSTVGDGTSDDALTLTFTITNGANPTVPKGNLIRGPGFRVWGKTAPHPVAEPNGLLTIFFEKVYNGQALNLFSADGEPDLYERGIDYTLPSLTNTALKFLVKYDYRKLRFSVWNGSSLIVSNVEWKDNMTQALGTNGVAALWTTNVPWLVNVTYTNAPFGRTNRATWEGVIGNTSQMPSGASVHAPWWPIKWMVSKGTNTFYSCGFNESKYEIAKFQTANPQFVVSNFSATGERVFSSSSYPTNMALKNGTNLYVLYNDGNLVSFDLNTCAKLAENLSISTFPHPTNGLRVPLANSINAAVHPETTNTAAVYYRTTDQVVVYTNASLSTWKTNFVIGRMNGYSNGPAIFLPTNTVAYRTNDLKLGAFYWDSTNNGGGIPVAYPVTNVALCFQSDGKLWVGDTPTSRMLRFDTNALCDSWFMFVTHSYTASVDPNDTKRAFIGYLEFVVDYAASIGSSWRLTNYWGRSNSGSRAEIGRRDNVDNGLRTVVTLTNGTFGLVVDPFYLNPARRRLVELTSTGIRATPVTNLTDEAELQADGSFFTSALMPDDSTGTNATIYRNYISSWSGSDPVYSTEAIAAIAYTNNVHPVYPNWVRADATKVYLFYPLRDQYNNDNVTYTGYHLGAITKQTNATWLWLTSTNGSLDGNGTFEPCCAYSGTQFTLIDDQIFYVFRGEGWRGGQANQIMNFDTSGRFRTQFGTPRNDESNFTVPGAAGSIQRVSGFKTNNSVYLYTADEWSHGLHRWRIGQ